MILTIFNKNLQLQVDTVGAQMKRILSSSNKDYLWKRDNSDWSDIPQILFPFIARLYNKRHFVGNECYPMEIHGFANACTFDPVYVSDTSVLLQIKDTPETQTQYPFSFILEIEYTIQDCSICITYRVKNTGSTMMPFGIGGHPGFCVPFAPNSDFSDYYLEFDAPCHPNRVGFDKLLLLNGMDSPYPLIANRYLHLKHDLFDDDAIILKNMSRQVSLKCTKSRSHITVAFPQMPYLGVWHMPHTKTPYVCIEPWSSLPGRSGIIEDFACRSDLVHLLPGETYTNSWSITINEE